jgi:hypothetical protein
MRDIKKTLRERVPEQSRPYRFYAFQRAISPRRLRVPKPRVSPGDTV